jgi:hypothetical protein
VRAASEPKKQHRHLEKNQKLNSQLKLQAGSTCVTCQSAFASTASSCAGIIYEVTPEEPREPFNNVKGCYDS